MKNSYCQQHFLEFIKLQNVPKELSERVLDYIIGYRLIFDFLINFIELLGEFEKGTHHLNIYFGKGEGGDIYLR